jgi:hypothetical protein
MKLKRMKVEHGLKDGWSRWVQPVKRGYLLACCDCGLVHRMDFRIENGRVQFRAQRAPMYTAMERARRRIKLTRSPQ